MKNEHVDLFFYCNNDRTPNISKQIQNNYLMWINDT